MSRDKHTEESNRFFTIAEVAEDLKVATRTVRRWITAGELVVHRFGGVVRVAACRSSGLFGAASR